MIDQLNQKVNGTEQKSTEYIILPTGEYDVEVVRIDNWKPVTKKNVMVNQRGEDGKLLRDSNSKIVRKKEAELTFYTCDVRLKVVNGDHKGRLVFTSLTTHPNAVFITQGFLFAIGEDEMTFGEIPTKCVERLLSVDVYKEDYTTTKSNPDTGMDETITKPKNRVKRFIRPSHIIETKEESYDV